MSTARAQLVSCFTRRYPFLSGCASFANSRLVHLAAGNSAEEVWTRLDCGADIRVLLNDYVGRAAFFVGDLDRKISEVARRIVRPGDHVLDIGANIGVVTMQLSRLVGDGGVVHSFEPNPTANRLLAQSIERNGATNVQLHRFALGEREGSLDLFFPMNYLGMATLKETRHRKGWSKVNVPVKTLSETAEALHFGHIRFLKMDVEGFELGVLQGAERWIRTDPPDAIVFETNEGHGDGEPNPVAAFLGEHGYRLYVLPKTRFSLRLTPARPDAEAASHDMLAVRAERADEVLSRCTVGR